jgi:NADH/NAD ratio-sensing transcriptional regulator Rex
VQAAADQLVEAGVQAILNLAPAPISAPEGVVVQQADLTTQLMLLSYQASLNGAARDE